MPPLSFRGYRSRIASGGGCACGLRAILVSWVIGVAASPLAKGQGEARGVGDAAASPGRPVARVMVIDQEDATRPAIAQVLKGFRTRLMEAEGIRPEIFIENLDIGRLGQGNGSDKAAARNWILEKYRGNRIDVIVPTSLFAVEFALDIRDRLSPEAVIVSLERPGEELPDPAKVPRLTGIKFPSSIDETLGLALQLFPKTRRVALISQTVPYPKSHARIVAEVDAFAQRRGIERLGLVDLGMDELRSKLRAFPTDTIVFYHGFWRDIDGRSWVPADALELLSRESAVPIFVNLDTFVGRGAIGGVCGELETIGQKAAELALRSLAGEVPPPTLLSARALLDARVLGRFGVPDGQIPPAAEVRFRQVGIWERYWPQIIGGITLVLVQGGLIASLVVQAIKRRKAERVVRLQQSSLERASRLSTLGQFAAALAHELGQPLGAILNNIEAAGNLLRDDPAKHAEELREIVKDIADDDRRAGLVLDRIRGLVGNQPMRVEAVDVAELFRDVLVLARPRLKGDGIEIVTRCEPGLPPIAGDSILLKQALLNLLSNSADAIAREGTTESPGDANAAADGRGNRGRRRGQSGKIELEGRVRLVPEGEPVVELTVSDNGPGVDGHSPSQVLEPFFTTKREGLGMGLPIALSIAEEHGGRLVLDNNPGSGLRVSLQIPVWNNKDFE